jgi:hypothetical protein
MAEVDEVFHISSAGFSPGQVTHQLVNLTDRLVRDLKVDGVLRARWVPPGGVVEWTQLDPVLRVGECAHDDLLLDFDIERKWHRG